MQDSDLEEGEIRDDEVDCITEQWNSCSNIKSSNIFLDDNEKIPVADKTALYSNYSKNSVHLEQIKKSDSSRKYTGRNRKNYRRSDRRKYNGMNLTKINRTNSNSIDHIYSSGVTKKNSKSGHNENKKPNDIYSSKRKYSSNSIRNRIRKTSIYKDKISYQSSFCNSLSDKTLLNNFTKNCKLSTLTIGNESIKPGSIGEILLNRKRKEEPTEILILSDSESSPVSNICLPTKQETSPKKEEVILLSDDENLMLLRKKALDSIDQNGEISQLIMKPSNESVSEVQNEPVDMEISISDDETNVKDKEFPIEWAFMMPPPASSTNDNNIQTLNRWCYDQNMCVQAMESINKHSNYPQIDYKTVNQMNFSEFSSNNAPQVINSNALPEDDTFSSNNLTGGHAKQYKDFMSNFCSENYSFTRLNTNINNNTNSSSQSNLIEIPLQVLSVPESAKNISLPTITDEEYDEDLLLATLLIDQNKRQETKKEKKQTNIASNQDIVKVAKKENVKKKSKVTSIDKKFTCLDNSNFFECGNYKFPKVKPVIINIESDSDSESEITQNIKEGTSDQIDNFIRRIRNSNQDKNIKQSLTFEPEAFIKAIRNDTPCSSTVNTGSNKTPQALSFLSKSKQEYYKTLKEKLRKKLTSKKLSKSNISPKKTKHLLSIAENKNISKMKKVAKSNLPVVNSMEICKKVNLVNKHTEKLDKKQSLETESSTLIVTATETFTSSDMKVDITEQLQSPNKCLYSSSNDDEESLRKLLLQSIKPKNSSEVFDQSAKIDIKSDIIYQGKGNAKLKNIRQSMIISNSIISNMESTSYISNSKNNFSCDDHLKNCGLENKINKSSEALETNSSFDNCSTLPNDNSLPKIEIIQPEHICVPKNIPVNSVQDKDILINSIKPKDITIHSIKSKDTTINSIKPKDIPVNSIKSIGIPVNFIKPRDISVNPMKHKDIPTNSIKLNNDRLQPQLPSKNILNYQYRKETELIINCDKNKKKEDSLLKHIEQEVVKKRNNVFSLRRRLTDDIIKSEKIFMESKSMIALISNLKGQLLKAEHNLNSKVMEAENNIDVMYEKKTQLKDQINRSKELQKLGEKLGKKVIGTNYTLPSPPSNYAAEYATIESDLCLLKNKVHVITLDLHKNNVSDCTSQKLNTISRNLPPLVKKEKFKIDKRSKTDTSKCQPLKKTQLEPTKIKRSFKIESCSDADVLCPHDLLGRCNDDSCIYFHLQTQNEEEAIDPAKSNFNSLSPRPLTPPSDNSEKDNNIFLNINMKPNSPGRVIELPREPEGTQNMKELKSPIPVENNIWDSPKLLLKDAVVSVKKLTKKDLDKYIKTSNTEEYNIRSRLRNRRS